MNLSSFYDFLYACLCMSLFYQPAHAQQVYLNITQYCDASYSPMSNGYLCDSSVIKSCQSFVTFRSQPPHDTAISIASLLSSEASEIASVNKVSASDKIPSNRLVVVPVSCSCSGSIFQHFSTYTVTEGDTYYKTAVYTFQGLATCQSMIGQNYYEPVNITVGAVLTVLVRCACPSEKQTADGITSLLTYTVAMNDTIARIGEIFGVNSQSILEANLLSRDSIIDPNTTVLVPLKSKKCPTSDGNFVANGSILEYVDCIRNGKKFPVKLVTLLGIGIGFAFICVFLLCYYLYQCLKRRRTKTRKENFFKQNGGFLLREKFSSYGISSNAKLFTAEELERATDNYNESRFLGEGGYGTVYKGMLPDGTIVAVKRSRAIDENQIEQFINEVVILTQINHRNIVKLLGCCLETEVPLLVYEYISNGTLSHHIRQKKDSTESSLSWEYRLRIACEVAGAVAYMHSAASIPIYHRDIKSSNILLDHNYSAKVSDFGTSKSVPLDKTHLTTQVQGTFGYMDPEYFQSCKFTDRSDTYSFGVTLVEILTGHTPYSFAKHEEENLVAAFISLTREDELVQILDPQVARDADVKQIRTIAELAKRCLRLNGAKRPSMKEVSTELEGLRNAQRCLETFREDPIEQNIDFPMEIESASL
ncbi:wall-associated receptor kinase-like 1 isoform X2 [Malus sylvestris]|uniref:wall-associated receptor kinase-like 1 isoform X2 n=1 Tax=Malus sylvestris TaxID=3752 RepID=UPI0021AD46D8|nr:wall-associated receptor kinase-like 1 isoform X2 [Malus sylvestris]